MFAFHTVFHEPNQNKKTWMHADTKFVSYRPHRTFSTHNMKSWCQGVGVTKTMCDTGCWLDHRPGVSKFNPRINDVSKLDNDITRRIEFNDIYNNADAA